MLNMISRLLNINSDSQWGIFFGNFLHKIFFVWSNLFNFNSGSYLILPNLYSQLFQYIIYLLFGGVSNIFIIFFVLLLTCFFFIKLSVLIFDNYITNKKKYFLILISFFSLFLISNNYFFHFIIHNNTLIWSVFFMILSVYLFFKYFYTNKKAYLFILSITTLIVLMDIHTSILIFMYIFSFYIIYCFISKKIQKSIIKDLLCFFVLPFILLNSYFIIAFFQDHSSIKSYNSGNSSNTNLMVIDSVNKNTSFSNNFIFNSTNRFFKNNIANHIDIIINFLIIIISLSSIVFVKNEKNNKLKNVLHTIIIQYLILISFSSGGHNPFGIFDFFYKHVPGFTLFRDFSKFNRLAIIDCLILFTYSIIKYIGYMKKDYLKKIIYILLILSFSAKTIYYYVYYYNKYKPSIIPDYYYNMYEYTKENKINNSCLSLPNIPWMQKYTWYKADYDIQDVSKYFSYKDLLFTDVEYFDVDYGRYINRKLSELTQKNITGFINLSAIKNASCIILKNDLLDEYKKERELLGDISNNIAIEEKLNNNNFNKKIIDKNLFIYSINSTLLHFYTPQTIIKSSQNISVLPDIVSQKDYNIRSATYFSDNIYNADDKSVFDLNSVSKTEMKNTPTIEFKKVNPTKYKVVIHNATSEFPLIFSESFHDGWKTYLATPKSNFKTEKIKIQNEDYRILDGNEDDQASLDELNNYIDSGYISSLGNLKNKNIKHVKWENNKEIFDYNEPYKIDFISKDFNGTIQNDNLEKGSFYETWLQKPIDDNKNHSIVNGYANSWDINPTNICLNNSKCIKNADGSYDMELIVEFWPQRLFYVGLFISGTTLLGCVTYLIVDQIKTKTEKTKKQNGEEEEEKSQN